MAILVTTIPQKVYTARFCQVPPKWRDIHCLMSAIEQSLSAGNARDRGSTQVINLGGQLDLNQTAGVDL